MRAYGLASGDGPGAHWPLHPQVPLHRVPAYAYEGMHGPEPPGYALPPKGCRGNGSSLARRQAGKLLRRTGTCADSSRMADSPKKKKKLPYRSW
ncbi:MAG TPA: hypothetical protein PKD90_02835 [Phnomibacter sp.]|nr:hypothetical protein [Phnomibacter sp.]